MQIHSVELVNFRNYEKEKIHFKNNLNVIVGKNAQGKTNLLESIFLCCVGKSFKTNVEKDLINKTKTSASIKINFTNKKGKVNVTVGLENNKKFVKLNEINLLKISQLLGNLCCVFFSPNELKLVKETPEDRRKFINLDLSQINKEYYFNLIRYNNILKERNKLLKMYESENTIKETLPIWDTQLANVGAKIIKDRLNFINKLNAFAHIEHKNLTSNEENLFISYNSNENLENKTESEIEQSLLNNLKINHDKDIKLKYTTIGPHRDDLKFSINGFDVKNFASQGQQRTVALSLKLAELEIFKEVLGEYPILLLDDVFSELDDNRQNKLINRVKSIQTIITTTNFNYNISANIIEIENAKIK